MNVVLNVCDQKSGLVLCVISSLHLSEITRDGLEPCE